MIVFVSARSRLVLCLLCIARGRVCRTAGQCRLWGWRSAGAGWDAPVGEVERRARNANIGLETGRISKFPETGLLLEGTGRLSSSRRGKGRRKEENKNAGRQLQKGRTARPPRPQRYTH